jgi:hypothetical protein
VSLMIMPMVAGLMVLGNRVQLILYMMGGQMV